ncbi:MAG: hypothetical protein GX442_16195 [Candidatus Riflebacteria bacterium]|nr:hypothetical protein [Candidatus Riflebacteria bacterium]
MPPFQTTAAPASRRGSAILVVGGVLVALLLLAGWFFQFMLMQSRLTQRQGQQRISTSLAFSLAVLAIQKIQKEILQDPTSELVKYLRKPCGSLGDLGPSAATRLKFETGGTDLSPVLEDLVEPLSALGAFSYEVHYSCQGSDFSRLPGTPYTREKIGCIHLHIATMFKKTGANELREEFHFVAEAKVTAAIVPLLSKFTVYVEDARESSDIRNADASFRLNTVGTNPNGGPLSPPQGHPWVLKNGPEGVPSDLQMDEMVKGPRGLIYLGGGRLYLNLARAWNIPGDYAEGFHLLKMGRGDGLYTIKKIQETYLMNWDQGVTADHSTGGAKDWHDLIATSKWAPYLEKSSAFRLYGVGDRPTPTLVLGEVFRSYIRARAIKNMKSPPDFRPIFLKHLPPGDLTGWRRFIDPDNTDEDDSMGIFNRDHLPLLIGRSLTDSQDDLNLYNDVLASNWDRSPYNRTLAMIQTTNLNPKPWTTLPPDPLTDLMVTNPTPAKQHAIPNLLKPLTDANDLKSMKDLLKPLMVPGTRTAWVVDPTAEGRPLLQCLQARGLYDKDKRTLNLNGWVYVEGETELKLDQKITVLSNGGIVLKKGGIILGHQIEASPNKAHLHLVTHDGDISVETNQTIEASLVAHKGKVKIGGGGRPKIRGSVAMSRFDLGSTTHGADITYAQSLAALPGASTEADSEADLLTFSLNPTPLFLK